jgi:hypothetical protein
MPVDRTLEGLAAGLRVGGIIAFAVAIVFLAFVAMRRRRVRRNLPHMLAAPRAPREERAPFLGARLEEFGLSVLAGRLAASRRLVSARRRAGEHILPVLGSSEWLIYRDLHLGCYPVPYTLIGTKGAYAILPTVEWSLDDVPRVAEIVEDLRARVQELGIAVAAVLYSPDVDESPRLRTTEHDGWELWTIGGRTRLWRWLQARPGPGLTLEQLHLLRTAEGDGDPSRLSSLAGNR